MRLFGFGGKAPRPDNVVLMLVSGWIFEWNLKSATEVGGNGRANDICVHEDVLYEAEPSGVFSWQATDFVPTATDGWATAVCSHGDQLYHSVSTGPSSTDPARIYETLTGKLVTERQLRVATLCSHGGRLFDGGSGGVYDTFESRRITDRQVEVLCSHGSALYDGGPIGIHETVSGRDVAYRRSEVCGLCSHAGVLYDASGYLSPRVQGGIYNSIQDAAVLDYANIHYTTKTRTVMGHTLKGGRQEVRLVTGMISVPSAVIDHFETPLRDYKRSVGR